MNFNFINTINLYWLQLYSIFVFYPKMLIKQSVLNRVIYFRLVAEIVEMCRYSRFKIRVYCHRDFQN